VALDITSRHGLDLTFHNGIWRGMAAFGVGVGSAVLYRAAKASKREPLPEIMHSIVQVALVGALLYAIWTTGWSHTHRDILTVLPMLGLVPVLAFDRGLVAKALATRAPLRLGEWSYAIYIGQTFWLQFFRFAEQRVFPAPETIVLGARWADLIWWTEPAMLVLVCVGWGALLAGAIERPANDLLRGLLSRRPVSHSAAA
jgi:peptidoglycan/LPS O-acetylase OafA/YrhL